MLGRQVKLGWSKKTKNKNQKQKLALFLRCVHYIVWEECRKKKLYQHYIFFPPHNFSLLPDCVGEQVSERASKRERAGGRVIQQNLLEFVSLRLPFVRSLPLSLSHVRARCFLLYRSPLGKKKKKIKQKMESRILTRFPQWTVCPIW